MRFGLNDDQRELQSAVRGFLARTTSLTSVLAAVDAGTGHDREVWRRIATELDLIGIAVAEEHGGSGSSVFELCVVLSEMGRAMYMGPYFASAVLATTALVASGDDATCEEHLPAIVAGETLATTVGASFGTLSGAQPLVRAARDGQAWRLTGRDGHVVDGLAADLLIVAAWAGDGVDWFCVAGGADGLGRRATSSLDPTRPLAALTFDQVAAVPLTAGAHGERVLRRVLNVAAVCLAAEQIGGAQASLELAVEYARQREQFGRPIGSFQAIKHQCANMLVTVEAARSAALYAAWAVDQPDLDADLVASMVKACCSEAYVATAKGAIQIYGGIGFTWEHPAHLFLRRAVSSQALFGSPALHRHRVADRIAA